MKRSALFIIGVVLLIGCSDGNVLKISEQGSFAVGGTVLTDSLGRTYHGDHAYVFYQKPVDARKYPLVFAHGVGQFSKTWETTPDGREGFSLVQPLPRGRLARLFQGRAVQPRPGGIEPVLPADDADCRND